MQDIFYIEDRIFTLLNFAIERIIRVALYPTQPE